MAEQRWQITRPSPHVEILAPRDQTAAVVFASPHSGNHYPPEFVAGAALDPVALRRSEDSFVDELYLSAPDHGAPLIRALFPRAFIDPNREPFELDPDMFSDALPDFVNVSSARVAAGLGTIARVVTSGREIYRGRLTFAEAKARVEAYYNPYHAALASLIENTRAKFGYCVLIDCHSMPSIGGPMDPDAGRTRVDFVLGDSFGTSCAPAITERVERTLKAMGRVVSRNRPYAGGFTTVHYGRPSTGVHALQIEINRALYMDEDHIARTDGLMPLAAELEHLVAELVAPADLRVAAE